MITVVETEAKEFEGAKGFEDIQYTTASYQKKMAEQTREPIQVGKLLSDGMKFKKLEDPMVILFYMYQNVSVITGARGIYYSNL